MPYDEELVQRVRVLMPPRLKVEERKMMGALTFMVQGKMCVCVVRDDLMARIDPDKYEWALKKKGCREMDYTGRPMKGFVFVGPEGTKTKGDLESWIGLALEFNKKAKIAPKKKKRNRSERN
jgi:TfoX/Sxy family transcriptional regulator of competence genes